MTRHNSEAGFQRTPSAFQQSRSALRGFFSQLWRQPLSLLGLVVVTLYLLTAIFGPVMAPYRYDQEIADPGKCIESDSGRVRCASLKNAPPQPGLPFGTDRNGRDVFSRVLWGARETIGLPTIATVLAVSLGASLGLATGYAGGWFDEIVSRALDSLLSIPALVLALVMITTIVPAMDALENPLIDLIGPVNISLIIVIVLLYIPIVARVIRSATLNIRDRGYVEAAKLRGESTLYILFREILPGVLPALVVEAALRLSYAIFLVASLGFLGLGVEPPSPEWGRMVLDARDQISTAPWALWYPVAAIAALIISINLMSDGLRRIFRYDLK